MKKGASSLKATWPRALCTFFFPIFLILVLRWAVLEPYVIPSGSMIPQLLVHDHILVKKFSYGLRWPFSDRWLIRWGEPQRGDIVVFRYPKNPEIFYVKRLVGLPGDKIDVYATSLSVNGVSLSLPVVGQDEAGRYLQAERFGEKGTVYYSRWHHKPGENPTQQEPVFSRTIPEGEYFFMGDNRDESSDGREWGTVPPENLIGPAWYIWLSCDEMLASNKFVCDPATIRWDRLFKFVAQQR